MHQHLHYRGPRRRRGREGPEKIFEKIIAEKFPNMEMETVIQVQEAQRVSGRINPRSNTQRHIVITLTKIKYQHSHYRSSRRRKQRERTRDNI